MTQYGNLRPHEISHQTQAVGPMENVTSFILNQDMTLGAGRKQTSVSPASVTQLAPGKLQIQESFAKDSRARSVVDICCRNCPNQMEEFPKSNQSNHYLFYNRKPLGGWVVTTTILSLQMELPVKKILLYFLSYVYICTFVYTYVCVHQHTVDVRR